MELSADLSDSDNGEEPIPTELIQSFPIVGNIEPVIEKPITKIKIPGEQTKRFKFTIKKRNPIHEIITRYQEEDEKLFELRRKFAEIIANMDVTLPNGKEGQLPDDYLDKYSRMYVNYIVYGQTYEPIIMEVFQEVKEKSGK